VVTLRYCLSVSLRPALPLLGNFPKILGIWESTWDLGNFPSNLGNSGISRKFLELLVISNLQRLTLVVFIRYVTAMFLQSLLLLTYRDHFLNIAYLDELISILNWFVQHWSKTE